MIQSAIIGLVAVLLLTRYLSSKHAVSRKLQDGDRTVASAPYWLPYVGHLVQLLVYPESSLRKLRTSYTRGVFQLTIGGSQHVFLFRPSLVAHLSAQTDKVADPKPPIVYLMRNCFGFPLRGLDGLDRRGAFDELGRCDEFFLSGEELMAGLVAQLRESSHELVTFSSSPVDQTGWERLSRVDPATSDGVPVVEADMLLLIRNFVAHNIASAVFGQDLLRNHPSSLLTDLWTVDASLDLLATGLPRCQWIPIPALTSARLALKRLHSAFGTFETALSKYAAGQDPGIEWSDLSSASEYVLARHAIYARFNLSLEARASCDMALFWSLASVTSTLVYWTLTHLIAAQTPLDPEGTGLTFSVPGREFAYSEPVSLVSVDMPRLRNCAILKTACAESVRLYAVTWTSARLKRDLILAADLQTRGAGETFLLPKGSYVHAAHNSFADQDVPGWSIADGETHDKKRAVPRAPEISSLGLFTRAASGVDGEAAGFAQSMHLAFTAVLLSLWDLRPVDVRDTDRLPVPRARDRGVAGVKLPNPIASRVLVRRRQR